MNKPYTVALADAADLPVAHRISAEVRFITEIERALGGADEVALVYRAWLEASECQANDVDAQSAVLAVRWPKAMDAATRAGMRNLGDIGEAHFQLRLERSVQCGATSAGSTAA